MKQGQGLLETIIAIGVITAGLISVISLVVSNLTNARETALRYQAINYAREGIELVRNIRDSNWLAQESSWEGIAGQGEELTLEFILSAADVVKLNPDTGGLQNNARKIRGCGNDAAGQGSVFCTDDTLFSRAIAVVEQDCAAIFPADPATCAAVESPDPIALEVTSEVTWFDRGGERRVQLTSTLYDWR